MPNSAGGDQDATFTVSLLDSNGDGRHYVRTGETFFNASNIGLTGAVAVVVIMFVAYLAGGYVAGRMARIDGPRQGLGVWIWMIVIAVVQMVLTDLPMALAAMLVFPLVILANVIYQRRTSPIFTRIQAVRAQVSEVAHESFDGATVVKTLGREAEETVWCVQTCRQLCRRTVRLQQGQMRQRRWAGRVAAHV